MEQEIIRMFFSEGLKQIEIANKLNISTSKVSRTLAKNDKYTKEKEKRKIISQQNHNIRTKEIMKHKREKNTFKNNSDDLILKQWHSQAAIEMSKGRKLSDLAYRNWNTSAYQYNKKKNRFEFREELGKSYDVKKYLKGSL